MGEGQGNHTTPAGFRL